MLETELPTIGVNRRKIGDPTGKAGQIVAVMERRLVIGYYKPDEMLSFNKLAEEFNVSRQPVSAAISHLRASGYVEVTPHVGCRVVKPSKSDIADFFLVLGKLEGAIASMAAERYRDREAETLGSAKPDADLAALQDLDQRAAYIDYVDNFHNLIWTMARTPLLESKVSGLRRLSNFYLWQGIPTLAPKASRRLIKERSAIAAAIAKRDGERASTLMERHIREKPHIVGIQ